MRGTFLRSKHLTLLAMNVLLLTISGIRYKTLGLDLRYFMPMVIVGLPWMALGGANPLCRAIGARAAVRRPFNLGETTSCDNPGRRPRNL